MKPTTPSLDLKKQKICDWINEWGRSEEKNPNIVFYSNETSSTTFFFKVKNDDVDNELNAVKIRNEVKGKMKKK